MSQEKEKVPIGLCCKKCKTKFNLFRIIKIVLDTKEQEYKVEAIVKKYKSVKSLSQSLAECESKDDGKAYLHQQMPSIISYVDSWMIYKALFPSMDESSSIYQALEDEDFVIY